MRNFVTAILKINLSDCSRNYEIDIKFLVYFNKFRNRNHISLDKNLRNRLHRIHSRFVKRSCNKIYANFRNYFRRDCEKDFSFRFFYKCTACLIK